MRQEKSTDFDNLYEGVHKIAMKLPEVEEKVDSFGHTSFRVKDKPFVMLGTNKEEPSLSIKTLKTTQDLLLQQAGYKKTPYIGQHGWTSFPTSPLDWDEIEDYILEAYHRTAPKSLLNKLNF